MNVRDAAFAVVYKIGPGWSVSCTRSEEKEDADFKRVIFEQIDWQFDFWADFVD